MNDDVEYENKKGYLILLEINVLVKPETKLS